MFSTFRERFGVPGVIAVVALVFATASGVAYAASGGLTGKQKNEVKAIAKQYAGKNGKNGKAGAQGPAGANGKEGPQGPQGVKGPAGVGEKGATGSQGAAGATGPAGPQGSQGATGAQGPQGVPGNQGATGAQGAQGPTGLQGAQGTAGAAGKSVVLKNTNPTNCGEGGFTYEIEGSGSLNEVCNAESVLTGPAGGVLDGNYPNPEFAADAVAPDSEMLDGLGASSWQRRIEGSCSTGEAISAVAADGSVTCVPLVPPGAGINQINVSGGLTGGGNTSTVSIGVDATQIQSRVTGSCPEGEAVKKVNQDGSVECEPVGGPPEGGTCTVCTGVWSTGFFPTADITWPVTISYPAPISPAPKVVWVFAAFGGEAATVFNPETGAELETVEEASAVEALCGVGTAANPDAEPGFLCVFPSEEVNAGISETNAGSPDPEAGALLSIGANANGHAKGTWAVNTQ